MHVMETRKTAIFIDGYYYRKRAIAIWDKATSEERANELYAYCMKHIELPDEPRDLYRIFYYDCPPSDMTLTHPLDNKDVVLKNSKDYSWTNNFFKTLRSMRKITLRMGKLAENQAHYVLREDALKEILSEQRTVKELKRKDFILDIKQKGVDMRIGLDASALVYGGYVNQIILISGDSDFTPVAKMARWNGVDFILDPLDKKEQQNKSLLEHVDIETYIDK